MFVILLPAEDELLPLPTREIKKPYPLQKKSKNKKNKKNKIRQKELNTNPSLPLAAIRKNS